MITIEKVVRFETKYSKGIFAEKDKVNILYREPDGIKEYEGVIYHVFDDKISVNFDNRIMSGVFNFNLENILAMVKM